jgi:outer membrane protein
LTAPPPVDVFPTAGFKNGYIPNLNTPKANYTAGISLQIPVFNGRRSHYMTVGARADLAAAKARTAGIEQQVVSEVNQAVEALKASLDKIRNSEIQVQQAEEAISLANTQYEAGVVTNLDLLDAQTAYAQAKLIHLRALYQYTMSRNQLNQAVGAKVW